MKSRKRKNCGLLMTVIFLIVPAAHTPARARMVVTQLTDNDYDDTGPHISGSKIVWMGKVDGPDNEICFYDGSTITRLTDNSDYDSGSCISGSNVVWHGLDGSDSEIFLYDGSTITQLTDNNYGDSSPHISGSNVVWNSFVDDRDWEIMLYNGSTITQLTDNSQHDFAPKVSGSNVVWHGWDGNDYEVFFYDGGTITQLTDNSYGDSSPKISGSNVVWWGYFDGGDSEIFLYDGSTITRLTDNSYDDREPQVSGSNVVWVGNDGSDNEIFLFDGSTITQLTNNSYNDKMPHVSGSNVVWTGFDGSDNEIFFYDGTTITQLSDNSYNDRYPQISGSNVVWYGHDGYDSEIYLAVMEPAIIYVDDDAPAGGNGRTWETAYNYLQDALAVAQSGDMICVAEGTYKPDQGTGVTAGDRYATFQLTNGVTIKGGYAGAGTPDPNVRDIQLYETILSGDLDGNDVEVNDPCDLLTEPTRADNCYHVVSSNNCDSMAVLDGVAITGGNASGTFPNDLAFGGGIYNYQSKPTVANCTFISNSAGWLGGGLYNDGGSGPTVTNCTFIGNLAGCHGGGLYNDGGSNPTVTNCTFSGNLAGGFGGGMVNHYGSPTVTNCTFRGNSASWSGGGGMINFQGNPTVTNCTFIENSADDGGGMRNHQSSPTVTNCTFSENLSSGSGGGIVNDYNSNPTVTNCTFINNTASYNGGGMTNSQSSPTVTNCNFINNTSVYGGGMANYEGSSPTVTNCIFKGNLALDSSSVTGGLGGGILNFYCNPTFINSMFSSNSAKYGGGIYSRFDNTLTVTNCTFTGNSAGLDGGGLVNDYNSTSTVTNCILWGNYAQNHGSQIAMGPFSEQCTVNISYSNVQGGQAAVYDPCEVLVWDTGNIDAIPCFVDPGYWETNGFWVDGDYHLLPGSPCIDAGDPDYVAGPNETDLDGKSRVIGYRIDMGAYEYEYGQLIPSEARIVPRTINLASKGNWITCYISLPEGYDVAYIDPNSILLKDEIKPESLKVDEEQHVAIARFTRQDVKSILDIGEIELTITGRLNDGTVFEASDVIKVIDKGGNEN